MLAPFFLATALSALQPPRASPPHCNLRGHPVQLGRRAALLGAGATVAGLPQLAIAEGKADKQYRLPPDKLAAIVTKDLEEGQFLVTGALTRSIYDESCTFKDEIDTYTLDKWIKGTSALFVGEKSRVKLDGPVMATADEVRFRFDEVLCFRIPLQPKVPLTGELILKRGDDGLITSYKEIWDTSVVTTLSRAYL